MGRRTLGREILATASAVNNTTIYSDSMKFETCTGDYAMKVIATAACSYTITQQCSDDNLTWYDPTDGNEGAIGAVTSTTTTAVSAWIVPTLAPAPYIRFKIVNSSAVAGTVTIHFYMQEETV